MAKDGVVILTGAASGIGRAAAEALARKLRTLALVDVNEKGLREVAEECRKHSPGTSGFVCDVADEVAVTRTYDQIRKRFSPPQALVNCAGIGRFAPFLEIAASEWLDMFHVNVMGTVNFTRAVLPDMLGAGEGTIVNVGSRMGIDPQPTTTAYAASKAGILGFSKALAAEVGSRGVKISYLAPGGTKTNIATPKHERYLEAASVAEAIEYILENKNSAWVRQLELLPLGF
jgi:short-subunit dehydrogenase